MATKKETRGRPKKYKTKKQATKAQLAQNYSWSKENRTAFSFRLNNETQQDVIEKLKSTPNKQEYLVKLVREDIKKGNN